MVDRKSANSETKGISMIRCRVCVLPSTKPDLEFTDGVCSACTAYAQRQEIDWAARKEDLLKLLDRHNGDVLVPSSGGKDSTYQVLKLIELGAKPLVVTATTCMLTSVGRRNIDNLARYATTIEVSPNKAVRAKLNRLGLTLVGDISWPEHVAIFTTPFKVAVAMGIPLIFYGENPQNQYGGPLESQDAKTMTRRWVSEFGGFLGLRPADLVGQDGITANDMQHYMPPDPSDVERAGVEAHFLGQYLPWDSHRNEEAAIKAGMSLNTEDGTPDGEPAFPSPANYWMGENLDNAMTGLHDHFMYRKFGYGRGCAQASVDIRSGEVSRAEALEWVLENDGAFPWFYMGVGYTEALKQIGVDLHEMTGLLRRFTNWDLFVDDGCVRPKLKETA